MTQLAAPSSTATLSARPSRRLWRIAGALALGHVVLLFSAITQEPLVEHGPDAHHIQSVYADANLTKAFAGGYVEAMSMLVLLAAIVLVAHLFSRAGEGAAVAASTFRALGVTFIAGTLAVGFPAGAAAMYWAHHGAQDSSVAMVNDLRNLSFVLQVAIQCGMAIALGISALSQRLFTKWVGWGGLAVGCIGIVVTPFAHNAISMAWTVWWVGLGVLLIRGRDTLA